MSTPALNDARATRRGKLKRCCRCLNLFAVKRAAPTDSVLERHHAFCRATDRGHTILLCRCCHTTLTNEQQALGVDFTAPTDLLRGIANILLGLAASLEILLRWRDLLVTIAERLRDFAAWLDTAYPAWRDDRRSQW